MTLLFYSTLQLWFSETKVIICTEKAILSGQGKHTIGNFRHQTTCSAVSFLVMAVSLRDDVNHNMLFK